MDTEDKKLTLPQRLAKQEEELKENQGFLQTYMLSPSPDFRPAEEERIREISQLADEMMGMLEEIIQANEDKQEDEGMDEDVNLEYKTHTLGDPDGEDNIEGDWNIDEKEMIPISEAETLSVKPAVKSTDAASPMPRPNARRTALTMPGSICLVTTFRAVSILFAPSA